MAGVELATAYISLVPSLKGLDSAISTGFRSAGPAFNSAGEKAGQEFVRAFGSAVSSRMGAALSTAAAGFRTLGTSAGSAVADVTRLATGLRDLAGVSLNNLASDIRRLTTGLAGMSSSSGAISDLGRLGTALTALTSGSTAALTNFSRDLTRISSALRSFAGSSGATTALRDITPALHALGSISSGSLTTAATDIRRIAAAVRTLSGMGGSVATINDIAAALARLGHAGGGIGNLGGINAQLRAMQAQIDALRRAAGGGGGSGGSGSGGIFGSLFGNLTAANLASSAISRVSSSLMGFMGSTVKATADFETTINTFGAVTKTVGPPLQAVSDLALKLGADVSIAGANASDAAVTMTELAKGGLSVSDAMLAAKGSLQLASAGSVSFAAAAQIQTSAMASFQLGADQAGKVADTLANTANAARGNISDFAEGLKYAGTAAHGAGFDLQATSTVLAIFAKDGLTASVGGTTFAQMLRSLEKASGAGATALKTLGVSLYDSQGNYVTAAKLADELAAAKKRMSKEDFNAALSTAFSSRSIQGARIFAQEGGQAFEDMSNKIKDGAGAAAFSTAKMKGLGGSFANLQNQVETAQVVIGEKFSPMLQTVLNKVADFVPNITGLLTSSGTGLAKIGDFFKPLISGASDLIQKAWPYVRDFVGSVWEGLKKVGEAVKPVADGIGAFFHNLSNSGAIKLLGGALDGIGKGFQTLAGWLKPIGEVLGAAIGWLGKLPGPIWAGAAALGAFLLLRGPLNAMITGLGLGLLRVFGGGLTASIASMGRGLLAAFGGPVGLAIAGITTALMFLPGLFKSSGQSAAEVKADVDNLAASFNQLTGAITGATRAEVAKQLNDNGTAAAARDLGLNLADLTNAALGSAGATKSLNSQIAAGVAQNIAASSGYQQIKADLDKAGISAADLGKAVQSGDPSAVQAKWDAYAATLDVNSTAASVLGTEQGTLNQIVSDAPGVMDPYLNILNAVGAEHDKVADGAQKTKDQIALLGKASGGAGQVVQDAMDKMRSGFVKAGVAAATTKDHVAALATQGVRAVTDSVTGAIFPTDQLSSNLVSIGTNSKGVVTAATLMSAAYSRYQTAATEATAETGLFLFAMQKLSGQNVTAAQAIEAQGAALRGIGASMRDQAAATDAVTTAKVALAAAQKKETDGNYTAEQKTLDVAAAQRTLAAAVSDSTASQDKNADAGRSLESTTAALLTTTAEAADAHGGYNAAVKAGEQVMTDARKKFIDQIATFGGTTVATAESTAAAKKLADQYGLIPANVKTILDADPKLATEHAADVKAKLDALAAAKYEAKLEAADHVSGKLTIVQAAMDAMRSKTVTLTVETSGGSAAAQAAMDASRSARGATGMTVQGFGSGLVDSVPALLAPGEEVIRADQAEKHRGLLKMINAGVGGFATGGTIPGVMVNMNATGSGRTSSYLGSFFGNMISGARAAAQKVADEAAASKAASAAGAALGSIAAAFSGLFGGGSGVERWRGLALQVAAAKGENPASVQVMLNQMSRESSGNPSAINLTDINAQQGHPSVGLLQFIPSTFASFADPGFNTNIYDPQSQMRAWYNYINAQYGGYVSFGQRGYGAYAKGGTIGSDQLALVHSGEEVISAAPAAKYRPLLKAINAQGFASGGTVNPFGLAGIQPAQRGARLSQVYSELDALHQAAAQAAQGSHKVAVAYMRVWQATGPLQRLQGNLANTYDLMAARLAAAQGRLDTDRASKASLVSSVAGTISGFDSGILGHTAQRGTPQTILQGLQFDLRKTQGFTAQLAKLRSSGLSPALLNQLASAGIDTAGGTVAALAGASRSQIGAINATQAKINAAGASGGALVGSAVYDPTIRADVAAVHAMQHQTGVLDAAMRQIAPAIGRAVDAAMHGIVLRIDPQGVARLVRTGEKALSGRA